MGTEGRVENGRFDDRSGFHATVLKIESGQKNVVLLAYRR